MRRQGPHPALQQGAVRAPGSATGQRAAAAVQENEVYRESKVLSMLDHPSVIKLKHTFQDEFSLCERRVCRWLC